MAGTKRIGIVGASGFTGAELLRLCAGHAGVEVVLATGDSQAGRPAASLYPSLAAAYPDLVFSEYDPAACEALDLVFLALPHGASQELVPELTKRVGAIVDLAADFRLRDAALYPKWYGEEHRHPELLAEFAFGLPELFRDEIVGATQVAAPGCYVTAASLAIAPLVRLGLIEPTGVVVDAASGVSGAGRGLKPTTAFCTVDEDFTAYGLLDHRHTPEIEQATGAQVLFTPHLAPMNRGILATCYARPSGATSTESLLSALGDFYDDEPFVVVSPASPSTKATLGSNTAHLTARFDERTGWIVVIAAIDNLVKGASGQALQCANLVLGLPEGTGLPLVGDVPVTVTAPAGFVAAGVAAGIKDSGAPDLALVATADSQPVVAAATFTSNKLAAAPVVVSRRHLAATGQRTAAVLLNSGNANAANGPTGEEHATRMAQATAAALGCRPDEVLVCSTGLIGIPFPIEVVEAGVPMAAAARSPEGGPEAARAIMTTDTVPKESLVVGPGFSVGGMAKGAAMLAPNMATMLAVLTTDAAAEPDRLQHVLQRAVDVSFNRLVSDGCTSTNDTVILLASGLAGPVDEADLERAVEEACFSLAAQMVGDAEGATKVVRVEVVGAATDDDADRGARAIARSQLTKCSWFGEDPYWGRIGSDLGSAGIAFDPTRFSIAYGGTVVAAHGVNVAHDAVAVAGHMAGRHLRITADLGLGDGQAFILTNDLTYGYIDENKGTS